jgi:hypothetical protein
MTILGPSRLLSLPAQAREPGSASAAPANAPRRSSSRLENPSLTIADTRMQAEGQANRTRVDMSEEEILERLARIESQLDDLSLEPPMSGQIEVRLAEIERRLDSIEKTLDEGLDYVI